MSAEEALGQLPARFEHLFESGILGVSMADLDGRITAANDYLLTLLGYDRADLPLRWESLTPDEWRARDRDKLDELRTTGAAQWDKECLHNSGARVAVTVCATLTRRGTQCLFVVLDCSARRRAEETAHRNDERYREKLRALALEVSVVAERERRRIAVGLHDRIGQNLAAVKLRIEGLQATTTDAAAAATLDEITPELSRAPTPTRPKSRRLVDLRALGGRSSTG